MPDLLIELFSEEIPARMQRRAADDLKRLVTDGLVEAGLTYASAGAFATPRRLTLSIEGLLEKSPNKREERKGPRTDAPEKALEGFLRSTGLTKDQLEARDDKKGQVWFATIETPGRPAADIVAEVLEATIRSFPWPKSMVWGAGSLRWVRPLHRILCVLSDEAGASVVPVKVDGIDAGDITEGHRFHAPAAFAVSGFDNYEAKLKRAHVILRADERADAIWQTATNMAFAKGLEVVEDKGLLAEVSGLVEWPVVLMGAIDDAFLDLPPEVLQTSMKEHQKFFSVKNPKTGRIEAFVTVANRETDDDGATILAGNQKVLSARLSDAKFFWENDLRVAKDGMGPWKDALSSVTFHRKLGTQAERVARIASLAREIAPLVGADPDEAALAAEIAKADLTSEMVYEFPELQGTMGRYYADVAGLPEAVAAAAEDHYAPLGPTDAVPSAPVSIAVALADKIDLLTGFWAIEEKPTGSKDPFALRRAALGVIRTITENGLRLSLDTFFDAGLKQHSGAKDSVGADLLSFLHDRLKVALKDQGIRHDILDSVLAKDGADDIVHVQARALALSRFSGSTDGENLIQGFKRANNILTQAEAKDGVEYSFGPDKKYAEAPEELALFDALTEAEPSIKAALEAEDFDAAFGQMASLRAPIDAFFEAVQVNAESQVLRRNRLNLLHLIRQTLGSVADLSRLEG